MFDDALAGQFYVFGFQHLLPLLMITVIVVAIILLRKRLRTPFMYRFFRKFLALAIINQEILLNVYRFNEQELSLTESLPLHLCGLAVILSAYMLLSENRTVFLNTFFILLVSAILALMTPAIHRNYGFPHYRYFQFFVSHGLIVVNLTFMLFVSRYYRAIRYRHIFKNVLVLISITPIIFAINALIGGNYMYLMGKPGSNTLFDHLGPYPWYLVTILAFAIPSLFHIFYLPFYFWHKRLLKRYYARA
jgi:hypothetical integral membrane protein (TIGR02206 family)